MNPNWLLILTIFVVLCAANVLIIAGILIVKFHSKKNYFKSHSIQKKLNASIVSGQIDPSCVDPADRLHFLKLLQKNTVSINLPDNIVPQIYELLEQWGIEEGVKKKLSSRFTVHRAEGLRLLGLFRAEQRTPLLLAALKSEKKMLLRLKIIHLLCKTDPEDAAENISQYMEDAREPYQRKVLDIFLPYVDQLAEWAEENRETQSLFRRRIIIQAARTGSKSWFFAHLKAESQSENGIIRGESAEVLFSYYRSRVDFISWLDSPFPEIKTRVAECLVYDIREKNFGFINTLLATEELKVTVIMVLRNLIREEPSMLPLAFKQYLVSGSDDLRLAWAAVLSPKINYFLYRLKGENGPEVRELIDDAVALGFFSDIINFINTSKSHDLRTLLFETIQPLLMSNETFLNQCRLYLKKELKAQLGIVDRQADVSVQKIQLGKKDKLHMVFLLAGTLTFPFILYYFIHRTEFSFLTSEEAFVSFIFFYHNFFIFYTLSISFIYLALMALSWRVIRNQDAEWNAVDKDFLFTPGVLPSVSVIAPAFNEERTIVQSVYSLLSLDYPELEVLLVDDGSSDKTAELLIDHFLFELEDLDPSGDISTAPVLGIYQSKEYSNLRLIRKQNGGKADSLNVGINFAIGEYICSIDADSLLEREALNKALLRSLATVKESAAIGGNIIPINGSVVRNGMIQEIHLPQNTFAKYQTVEYLRSFIAGRLGWTRLNSLLIISGAFGIFKKKNVLDIGGYMTGRGLMRRDTVGEDMELVVRLAESLALKKIPYKVDYAFNANCWTEVPEEFDSLLKQRDRWHRGLIEIMIYHKNMLFNRKNGAVGLVAFPYYYLFELLGPFWETLGYFVLVLSLVLGLVSLQVFLLMFSVVILLGIFSSGIALYLAERDVLYFQGREFFSLIKTAFLENFGYRQLISMIRAFSYVSYLFKNKGWQKFARKGFESGENENEV